MLDMKRLTALLLLTGSGFILSCEQDDSTSFVEGLHAVEESMMDAYFEDADDLAGILLATTEQAEGTSARISQQLEVIDARLCEGTTLSVVMDEESELTLPIGVIVLDFGTGCTDAHGTIRKGKIRVSFSGRRFRPESVIEITFQNYSVRYG